MAPSRTISETNGDICKIFLPLEFNASAEWVPLATLATWEEELS